MKKLKAELKISNTALIILLWVKIVFCHKCWAFAQKKKKCWHEQNYGGLGPKRHIFWNCICAYTKFQVSSIILNFWQMDNFTPTPTPKRAPKKPTIIRVNIAKKGSINFLAFTITLANFYHLCKKEVLKI